MDTKKWKREVSAGGVVYKKEDGKTFVLIVNPRTRDYGQPADYWTFPKGKIEEGDTKEDTALREVTEEAGVVGKIEQDLSYIKYFKNDVKVLKFVHYFLMKYESGDPARHDEEIAEAKWVSITEVGNYLKFDADKEIFQKAKNILEK